MSANDDGELDPRVCRDHRPTQHRDRLEPWCGLCGRTADGSAPRPPEPVVPPRPPLGTRVQHVIRRVGVVVEHIEGEPDKVRVTYGEKPPTWTQTERVAELRVLPAVE